MFRVFYRSLTLMIASAFAGSVVIFLLLRMVGGDIATIMLGTKATPESLALLREAFGLNRSWLEQYLSWIGGVFRGDLGEAYTGQYVIGTEIAHRLEPTLILTFGSLLISIPIALMVGVYSAINFKRWRGVSVDVLAQVGLAIPQFFLALVFVIVFAVRLGWLPATGYVSVSIDPLVAFQSMVLPITTLSLGITAVFTRFVRTSMIEQMNEDYMRTAKAKGHTVRSAAIVHGLRNSAIPITTTGVLQIGALMAGSVVVENVFGIPGIGRLLLTSVMTREAITVQSLALVILLIILAMNLLIDLLYGFLDPRIRHKEGRK